MNLLLAGIFILLVVLIGAIPFPLIYLFSGFIHFMLQHIIGYRRKVIFSNLKGSFPELAEKDIRLIAKGVYKNLADVTVEGFKAFSMTSRQIKKRHFIINPEIAEAYLQAGKSIIALPAHFNNWEWGSLSPGLFLKYPITAFYKPLSNKYIDWFLKRSRSKYGTTLASIATTASVFKRNSGIASVYIMAADQSPANGNGAYWVPFLGRDTAFLHGPERYARMFNLPIVYVDVQRIKRGYYTLDLSVLADNPQQLPEGEITRRYAEKLEDAILKNPGSWLWSHKRWKLTR
jgi:Kdo2-lipid IVA lauroyltransferase/acyltransferase